MYATDDTLRMCGYDGRFLGFQISDVDVRAYLAFSFLFLALLNCLQMTNLSTSTWVRATLARNKLTRYCSSFVHRMNTKFTARVIRSLWTLLDLRKLWTRLLVFHFDRLPSLFRGATNHWKPSMKAISSRIRRKFRVEAVITILVAFVSSFRAWFQTWRSRNSWSFFGAFCIPLTTSLWFPVAIIEPTSKDSQ